MQIDGMEFTFPDNWEVEKYDDWVFYKKRFQSIGVGQKAVDIVAKDPRNTLWLIEVKDYRIYKRTKVIDLADVQQKLRKSIKAIDPHPRVTEGRNQHVSIPWTHG